MASQRHGRRSSPPAARCSATQEFTSNKALLLRAVNNFIGQKIRSETEERLDDYQRQQAVPVGPSNNTRRSTTRSTWSAATTRGWRSRRYREDLRLGRQHPRPPQGHCLLQRGHRLRHLRLQQARSVHGHREDERRHRVSARARTSHLLDRSARADLARRRIRSRCRAGSRPIRTAALTLQSFNDSLRQAQNSLRTPLRRDRRLRRGEPERLHQRLHARRQGQQRATTCWATTRRTTAATAGSGASR